MEEKKNYLKEFQFSHLGIISVASSICSEHQERKTLSNPAVKLLIKK